LYQTILPRFAGGVSDTTGARRVPAPRPDKIREVALPLKNGDIR
jgi:hypothetical protein